MIKHILSLVVAFSFEAGFATAAELTECRNVRDTQMRMMPGLIPAGALAVDSSGKRQLLAGVLSDDTIHFMMPDGSVSSSYQWFYTGRLHEVATLPGTYLVKSYGEYVVVTIQDEQGVTTVDYEGTVSGNYLSLRCH